MNFNMNPNALINSLVSDEYRNQIHDVFFGEESLSEGQKSALNSLLSGNNILLTGPAGTGKSYLVNHIRECYEKIGKRIGVTSTTGASAIIIGGRTLHSWAGIGICGSKESALKRVMTYRKPQERIRSTNILIIDEVSMLPAHLLDILDYIFKLIRRSSLPFGGMQIILVGDFYQLSPVKSDKYAFEADCWNESIQEVHELKEIFRQCDVEFATALNEIRIAEPSLKTIELLTQCLGKEFEGDIKPTELYSVKADVSELNEYELWELASEDNMVREIASLDELIEKPQPRYPRKEKFILESQAKMNKQCAAPQILQLCIGCQVMLIKNLNIEAGLANGSRGVVTGFATNGQPIVKFMNGQILQIGVEKWTMRVNETVIMRRTQYPLILAWSITIHKSQGSTIDLLKVDLGSKIFSDGQSYCALSRSKSLEGLSIISIDWDKITCNKRVKEFYQKYCVK